MKRPNEKTPKQPRHPGESRYPAASVREPKTPWIPAFAGMTAGFIAAAGIGYELFAAAPHFTIASFITKCLLLIPHMGSPIVAWLWQGFSVDDPVLPHFYIAYGVFVAILIGVALMLVSGTSKKRP